MGIWSFEEKKTVCLYDQGDLEKIMIACIILHNMIVEYEKEDADEIFDLNEAPSTSVVQPP